MLNAEFAHVCMPRHLDAGGMRHSQDGSDFLQQRYREIDAPLFLGSEGVPPMPEFIREFDFPSHCLIMLRTALCRQGHIDYSYWLFGDLVDRLGFAGHIVHQQILAERIWGGEIRLSAAHLRNLLDKLNQAIVAGQHEGVDENSRALAL